MIRPKWIHNGVLWHAIFVILCCHNSEVQSIGLNLEEAENQVHMSVGEHGWFGIFLARMVLACCSWAPNVVNIVWGNVHVQSVGLIL
jgi:hypothetical protein